ncbi:DUF2390 domain-containing protein [Lacimicrobium sp. SS2-24]|uniref:DUF2390 domain-containing protein n=1 Tax=Lacimicrobium sp. SS2-24 TaxID=2005569 RepID=UPI0014388C51|nr:DUF2390 domain-containing protein [Lacimicrobium sp. SS2-24]
MNFDANDFWHDSIHTYQQCQSQLLVLQDTANANVNLLLLCVYLQNHGRYLTTPQLAELIRVCEQTQEQILSVRRARRQAKGGPAYTTLKQAELELEKQQQQDLIQAVNAMVLAQQGPGNVTLYGRLLLLPNLVLFPES